MNLRKLPISMTICGALFAAAIGSASADRSFPAAVDCWTTVAASTAQLGPFAPGAFTAGARTSLAVGTTGLPVVGVPLAPGACACTQPAVSWFDAHGNPVQPLDKHAVQQTTAPNTNDTCVSRDSFNATALGSPVPVPVEMLALHLRGTLSVPMNTGLNCTYTVDIQLTGSQTPGSMTITPTKLPDLSHGTVNLTSLPVGAQATFTPTSGCDPHNALPANTEFSNTTGTYQVAGSSAVPALSPVGIAILAGALLVLSIVILRRRARMDVA